ncbi:hypothetical protein [Rhizobium beringeri]|uniref:hypothetical protein n=1 Tax=Rhizobium beringeri TaxID=3019934 RepID=UPI002E0E14D8|nr:hypothetical protein U8P75_35170 [Rhizobium beringeri]WSH84689.1 hypothetical protein U8P69_34675 [Rhizobium beringeri]
MRSNAYLCVISIALLAGCAGEKKPDYNFVQTQWSDSILRLGADLAPVYPPTEDIQLGDVFAIEAETGSAAEKSGEAPLKSLRLGYVDGIIGATQRHYLKRLKLPESIFTQGGAIDRTKDQGRSTKAAFSDKFTHTLPITAFPEYTIARGSLFNFSASLPGKVFGFLFGFGATEDTELRVSVADNNTFGIPAYEARALLADFCRRVDRPCDTGHIRNAFYATYGYYPTRPVFVRLISRVYVTRTINYTYLFRSASAVRAVQARLDTMKVFAEKASTLVTPPATPVDNPATIQDERVESARDVLLKQMLDGINKDLTALSGNTEGNAFGFSALSYAGNSISLAQSFARPLTFAYAGVWYVRDVHSADLPGKYVVLRPGVVTPRTINPEPVRATTPQPIAVAPTIRTPGIVTPTIKKFEQE